MQLELQSQQQFLKLIAVSETVALRKLIDVKRYLIQGLPFILFGFLMFSVIHDLYVLNDIITLICKVMIGAIVYLVCSWLYIYRFYPDVITSLKVFRRKKNEKVTCISYHATGSGAVDDYLREFDGFTYAPSDVECRFYRIRTEFLI